MTFVGGVQLARINNPATTTTLDESDDGAVLAFGIRYIIDNVGGVGDPFAFDLPLQVAADKGKKLYIHTRYTNDPYNTDANGFAGIKRQGSDTMFFAGSSQTEIELMAQDDNIVLVADGAGVYTFE